MPQQYQKEYSKEVQNLQMWKRAPYSHFSHTISPKLTGLHMNQCVLNNMVTLSLC